MDETLDPIYIYEITTYGGPHEHRLGGLFGAWLYLYSESTRSWLLSSESMAIFFQITRNKGFWPLTLTSGKGNILNLLKVS